MKFLVPLIVCLSLWHAVGTFANSNKVGYEEAKGASRTSVLNDLQDSPLKNYNEVVIENNDIVSNKEQFLDSQSDKQTKTIVVLPSSLPIETQSSTEQPVLLDVKPEANEKIIVETESGEPRLSNSAFTITSVSSALLSFFCLSFLINIFSV